MSHSIENRYSGDLRTESTHLKSSRTIITDAPTDNNGKGNAFSPTDLVASALCSCMTTVMGICAEKNNFEPNIDIVTGPNIRIHKNSGVDLTARPFNLKTVNVKNICSIGSKQILGFEGVLNTQILQLYK